MNVDLFEERERRRPEPPETVSVPQPSLPGELPLTPEGAPAGLPVGKYHVSHAQSLFTQAYQKFLGRTPSPAELGQQMADIARWFPGEFLPEDVVFRRIWDIYMSPEALALRTPAQAASSPPPPSTSEPGGGGTPEFPPPVFTDPTTQLLEGLARQRMQELLQPLNDPAQKQLADLLQNRVSSLGTLSPDQTALLEYLRRQFQTLGQEDEAGRQRRLTSILEGIEADRAATKQRLAQALAARGITPESGVFHDAMLQADVLYDQLRESGRREWLTAEETQIGPERRQEALGLGTMAAELPETRTREQLDVAGQLADLFSGIRAEEEGRKREALSLAGMLADLPVQRLQVALQVLGLGGQPMSLFQSLLGLTQLGEARALQQRQQNLSLFSNLGFLLALALGGRSGATRG